MCVFQLCAEREFFRLIKEMIYRSMMLEEFPDRSSNRVFSNELSPLNHSRPQKSLSPPRHLCTYTCMHTRTFITHITVHPRSWEAAQIFACESMPLYVWVTERKCQFQTKTTRWLLWYFWTLQDHKGVATNFFCAASFTHFATTSKTLLLSTALLISAVKLNFV